MLAVASANRQNLFEDKCHPHSTAPDDLVFTISAIWCPTGEYDVGSQWHDVQANLRQKKTKCWIQLPIKTLNACIIFKSRDTSESKKQLVTKASQPPASSAEPVAKTVTTVQHTPEVEGAVLPPYGPLRRLFICFFIPCVMSLSR